MLSRWRAGSSGQVRGRSPPGTSGVYRALVVTAMLGGSWCRAVAGRRGGSRFRPAAAWVMVLVGLDAFAMTGAAGALHLVL